MRTYKLHKKTLTLDDEEIKELHHSLVVSILHYNWVTLTRANWKTYFHIPNSKKNDDIMYLLKTKIDNPDNLIEVETPEEVEKIFEKYNKYDWSQS